MQLDEEIRVQPVEHVQPHHPSHPTITYSGPISFSEQSTGDITSPQPRYHIIAPFPRDSSQKISYINQPRILTSNTNCLQPLTGHHSLSIVSQEQLGSPQSPQSTINLQGKPILFSSTNPPTVPNLPQFGDKDSWRRLPKHRLSMTSGTVKRSISIPNVHQASLSAQAGIQYSTDKRRNKLGYHRTSVACGHCRRRKIRCQMDKDDHQGRCSNCIRLKKDCNFFPVETTERRPRSLSKPDISTNETSSSASSPSPRLNVGKVPREMAGAYTTSLPVTPTIDFHSTILGDGTRHHSVSSAPVGRLSVPHSNATSRRTSVTHTLPSHKPDHDFTSNPGIEGANFARIPGYRMGPLAEVPSQNDHLGLDSAYWRLTSSPMGPNQYAVYTQHPGIGSMTSIHSAGNSDPEEAAWSTRMNTIDPSMTTAYSYPPYATDLEYHRTVPDLYNSASASTASLAQSNPDGTQFADSRGPSQLYMNNWADQANAFSGAAPMKPFYDYPPTTDAPLIYTSPHQSPKYVS